MKVDSNRALIYLFPIFHTQLGFRAFDVYYYVSQSGLWEAVAQSTSCKECDIFVHILSNDLARVINSFLTNSLAYQYRSVKNAQGFLTSYE